MRHLLNSYNLFCVATSFGCQGLYYNEVVQSVSLKTIQLTCRVDEWRPFADKNSVDRATVQRPVTDLITTFVATRRRGELTGSRLIQIIIRSVCCQTWAVNKLKPVPDIDQTLSRRSPRIFLFVNRYRPRTHSHSTPRL